MAVSYFDIVLLVPSEMFLKSLDVFPRKRVFFF